MLTIPHVVSMKYMIFSTTKESDPRVSLTKRPLHWVLLPEKMVKKQILSRFLRFNQYRGSQGRI